MSATLHEDDPPDVWRAYAVTAVSSPKARAALLTALARAPDDRLEATVPTLIARARGHARLEIARAVAAMYRRRVPTAAATYALFAELTGSPGPSRTPAANALRRAPDGWQPALALAIAASGRVARVRGAGERERAGLAAWRRAGGDDPLEKHVDLDAVDRAWRSGDDAEAYRDHALILCTAGARPAAVEQLRAWCERTIERAGHASPGAAPLLAWLGRTCGSADDLWSSARAPSWRRLAARALARTAVKQAGHGATLLHVAGTLAHGTALDRAIAVAALEAAVDEARRGPGAASSAIGDAAGAFIDALAGAQGDADPALGTVIAHLLGVEREPSRAGRWVSGETRARLHAQALVHTAPGARDAALSDLETRGVPAAATPLLARIAQSDPSAVTRARARALVRAATQGPG